MIIWTATILNRRRIFEDSFNGFHKQAPRGMLLQIFECLFQASVRKSLVQEGKLLAFALVPPELVEAGMKADDWIRAALEPCGGRGGGKPGNAQGQAKECSDVAAVEEAAAAFAGQYA